MSIVRLNKLRNPVERSLSILALLIPLFLVGPTFADEAKVAFIGDQGTADSARQVLELIRDEGTELLLIQGDLGYEDNSAQQWIDNIDQILGDDFPVLMVVGNHENFEWDKYVEWQRERLDKVSAIRCEGDISVKAYCTYKDIGVVQVAPAITEVEGINGDDDYAGYITEQFQSDDSLWRICSFHKNMRDMQVGGKGDATGWGVYQNCLAEGAIVVNGHEHSYSRTHLMSDFENLQVVHRSSDMEIGLGESITIVSGLGGREIRPQQHGGDWFASIYTSSQNANFGTLFCEFVDATANCYMKDIAGLIPDVFTLSSGLPAARNLALDEAEADLERQETEAQAQRELEEAEAEAQAQRELEETEAEAQAQRELEEAEAEAQAQRELEEAEAEAQAQRELEEAEAEAQAQRELEEAEAEAQAQRELEEAEAEAQAQRELEDAEAEAQAQRDLDEADAEAQAQRELEAAEAQAQRELEDAEAEAAQAQRDLDEADAEAQAQAQRELEAAEAQAQRELEDAEAEAAQAQRDLDEAEAQAQQNAEDAESQNDTDVAEANPITVGIPIGVANDSASRAVDGSLPPPNLVVNDESDSPVGNVDSISADVSTDSIVASAGASGGALHWIVLLALGTLALIRREQRAFKR